MTRAEKLKELTESGCLQIEGSLSGFSTDQIDFLIAISTPKTPEQIEAEKQAAELRRLENTKKFNQSIAAIQKKFGIKKQKGL